MSVLLEAQGLCVDYLGGERSVRACAEVDLTLRRGEILGIAGESGSGKSTLITALTQLQRPPAAITAGRILLHRDDADGGGTVDLTAADEKRLRALRWREMSIVLQSAMDALNPVMRLSAQFADVLREHRRGITKEAVAARTAELLGMVGIPAERSGAYPHEMSGGMRQRATIALALACDPALVVMDEPTTAVDVVMQRQIMKQILGLRRRLGFAVVFVTHDLSLLLELADRIAIMYAGRIVEIGAARAIHDAPQHPYTRGLRDSFPPLHAPLSVLHGIPGTPPDPADPPPGCAFHPRCDRRLDACDRRLPRLGPVADGRGLAACLLHEHPEEAPVS
ncbi:dipeptide/oligopeptide/nickel ABC transporter ATP-binding protein [Mangrovactinospora gilvigrisea]|uniref:Dipeptide/oligopeptide/nickel ABC transporter ATP-binding protein n=1 Tax=Mangrovactinospora gilvigrisea TaxID=1428644 RepID=A0A1J7C2U5_9ACTN|nr:ABC transporter ATP-binding protein [Mangrovactinospora gilvigrisea]OIV35888.1 dipeptide/oligopeptide/nickel ABC transporter ATP-binding protein [Mangrovactinospora gilvigrisea]